MRDLTIENSEESHKFVYNIKICKLKGEEKIEICNIDDLEDTEIITMVHFPCSDLQLKIEDYEYVFKCFNRSKLRSIFENNIYLNLIQYDYFLYYYAEGLIQNKIIRSIRDEKLRLKFKYVEDSDKVRTTEDYEVFFW